MILTRTPLRLSLIGGGTDMPSFTAHHTGAVISTAIDKYIYVLVNPKFDGRIRVSYSITENVDNASEIRHDIVREAMKLFELKGLEIVSVSDIPGEGSGLGSSSSFTVGLLCALYAHCGFKATPRALAEHAFTLEAKVCGHPVGRQDHYAATYGGFMFYEFSRDKVKVESFGLDDTDLAEIGNHLMLFWVDSRKGNASREILQEQMRRFSVGQQNAKDPALIMVELTRQMKCELDKRSFTRIGRFVRASWSLKKRFSDGISNDWIDDIVSRALAAEADGAKICGAGGGGFMLIVADPVVQPAVEKAVGIRRVPFKIGVRGSQVIPVGG